ncbi:MAG TPA: hypothetical protein VJZ73_13275 [Methylomirabilota bacterium]|nr:hypothetical protein [Methylomirabilota bacterium]
MRKPLKKRIVWTQSVLWALVVLLLLVELAVAGGTWRSVLAATLLGVGVAIEHQVLWARWRRAEIELAMTRRMPYGRAATITLLAGQDLRPGQLVVINDRGFAVVPERPIPPPARAGWVRGFVGDDTEVELDV